MATLTSILGGLRPRDLGEVLGCGSGDGTEDAGSKVGLSWALEEPGG